MQDVGKGHVNESYTELCVLNMCVLVQGDLYRNGSGLKWWGRECMYLGIVKCLALGYLNKINYNNVPSK